MKKKSAKKTAAVLCVILACAIGTVGYVQRESVSRVCTDIKKFFSGDTETSVYYNEATRTKINYEVEDNAVGSAEDVTIEEYEKINDGYASAYFLQFLSEKEQKAYYQLYKGIYEFDTNIAIEPDVITKDEVGDFIVLFTSSNPYINYIGENYTISVTPEGYVASINVEYSRTQHQYQSQRAAVDEKIEEILEGISGDMTDYEKVKYFHDHIVLNSNYDENGLQPYTAYGCLVDGRCVCEGYAKAMMALCDRAGINCIPVVGEAGESEGAQAHIWNKIQIDGAWYGFDVTWDDPVSDIGEDYIRYDYFGVTDAQLDVNHFTTANRFMMYPAAMSDSADYFVMNNLVCNTLDDPSQIMERAVNLALDTDTRYARIKCADDSIFEQADEVLFGDNGNGNSGMFTVLNNCIAQQGRQAVSKYSIIKNEQIRTITVKFMLE